MRIKGKNAIVTGASSGLGRAVALRLARLGANVALVARRQDKLQEVAAEAREHGTEIFTVPADVSKPARVDAAFRKITSRFKTVDILVNAAGVGVWKPFLETTQAEHRRMMDVNYWGTFYWIRNILPMMRKRGEGSIVNISSGAGKIGFSVTGGYSASKFAVTGLSEALHRELLGTGVTVSCLHPGSIKTGFWNEKNIPQKGLPPIVRYAPKLSPASVARNVCYAIWLNLPVRTLPFFVGILTRLNAIWIRLGDLILWKWFIPALIAALALRFAWKAFA